MSNVTHREIHKMIDHLTDTLSWDDLAKELDKCIPKAGDADQDDAGITQTIEVTQSIEMADLLKSLKEYK
ncbi:MAG: hypothetical protein H7Y02_12890 [Candidatus Obscuribacterales bacterium]|nr:hypothetical protein [Steroidobacteraceae bacterium]